MAPARRLVLWVALTASLWFVLGLTGVVVGAVVAAGDLSAARSDRKNGAKPPAARGIRLALPRGWMLPAAVVLLALIPIVLVASGLPTPSLIGPRAANGHRGADRLTQAGVALLVIGVLRDVLGDGRRGPVEPGNGVVDATGMADATDATDVVDATDVADATDATDVVDAADAADAADALERTVRIRRWSP
jgi:hypothetical protein